MNSMSSYASSKSLMKFDEDYTDSRIPETVERLPTGFRLVLDEHFVVNVIESEKPRDTLQDLMVVAAQQIKYMRRENILQNFEKMELVLIADFHYYNLIFCKEDLMLSNRKTAILLNIFWELLSHNNPGYARVKEDFHLQTVQVGADDKSILDRKQLKTDVQHFRDLLCSHSTGKSEEELRAQNITKDTAEMKVFEVSQVQQIVEYAFSAYIDKFNLYKYVFENKKKNEEVFSVLPGQARRHRQRAHESPPAQRSALHGDRPTAQLPRSQQDRLAHQQRRRRPVGPAFPEVCSTRPTRPADARPA